MKLKSRTLRLVDVHLRYGRHAGERLPIQRHEGTVAAVVVGTDTQLASLINRPKTLIPPVLAAATVGGVQTEDLEPFSRVVLVHRVRLALLGELGIYQPVQFGAIIIESRPNLKVFLWIGVSLVLTILSETVALPVKVLFLLLRAGTG